MTSSTRSKAIAAWSALLIVSAVLALILGATGIPASLLLGPMLAGILFATSGCSLSLSPGFFIAAQAIVGCLIASSINASIFALLVRDWMIFAGMTLATVAASTSLGYLLGRWKVVPKSVAIWGSSPGGATAMVVMAEQYGADVRMVAVMVYTRVVAVASIAAVISAVLAKHGHVGRSASALPGVSLEDLGLTMMVAAVGGWLGWKSKIPAGALICAIFLGAAVNIQGALHLAPPRPLLALAYAVVGLRIGLTFTRMTVRQASKALPSILLMVVLLISFCGGLAVLVSRHLGVDLTTAYLATSPGGMDSIAIIAASSSVANVPFVMAAQVVRFIFVLLIGPSLVGAVARRTLRRSPNGLPDQ